MSRLDLSDRVYPPGHDGESGYEAPCMWFARCANPANGIRQHPVLHNVPICQRCDDKIERLGA